MKERESFIEPELEIIGFSEQDIIITSDGGSTGGGGGIVLPDDEW